MTAYGRNRGFLQPPQNPPNRTTSTSSRGAGRIAAAQYGADADLSNPSAFKAEEIRARRDQIVSNLERAWGITGRSEDQLTAHPFTIRALPLAGSNTLEQSRAN